MAPDNACQREPNRHPLSRLRPWLRPRPRAHSNPLNSGWRAENVIFIWYSTDRAAAHPRSGLTPASEQNTSEASTAFSHIEYTAVFLGSNLSAVREYQMLAPPPAPSLVSVSIMTCDRLGHLRLALRLIDQQDYPALEVVVVADGPLALLLPIALQKRYGHRLNVLDANSTSCCIPRRMPRIQLHESAARRSKILRVRLVALAGGPHSIGYKRNLACAAATGAAVVHWDDDDLYGPQRVRTQSAPILSGLADMTFAIHQHLGSAATGQFHRIVSGSMFMGSMAYRRDLCERHPFPDCSLGEDFEVAETAARSCHRTKAVRGIQSVYTRSNMSTSFGHFPSSNVDYTRAVVPSFVTASLLRAYTQAGRRFAAPGSRSCRPAHLHNAINAKQIEHWPNKLPKRCSGRATPAAPRPRV